MWPGSSVLIVTNALIFLVHSSPPDIDWNTLCNDSDPVTQNERILKLFLQLAAHTANRLALLRKGTDKEYDCSRRNDNLLISTTEALMTQSPSQANLEWLDKSKQILNHSTSGDFEINEDQNHAASYPQLQEFDPSNFSNIDEQNVIRNLNSKMSNLIPKSVQDVRDASSDISGYNHEVLNSSTLRTPILDLDTASNSLNANEFGPDSRKSTRNDINEKLLNQIDLVKNVTNTSVMNDLSKTVNKFFPKSQNLQESTFSISQRLFGTDLAQIVPKIISPVHENANQYILPQNTQHTRELSDRIDDINPRFFDPIIIKNSGNILNPQAADNLPVVNQILSSTKNIAESMIRVLPEATKGAGNLLNQIIPRSQETINRPLKVVEEGRKYPSHSGYTQQEQSKTAKQAGNQFDDLLHNQQDLTSNAESNIREAVNASERNNQETTANYLPINDDNSTAASNNRQNLPTLLKDSFIPLLRSLPDFNEHENNNSKTETDLSSIQTNDNANSFTDEKQSIKDYKKMDQRLDQIDEEIKAEGFKKMNEIRTDYSDEQLNPISEDLSQKSKESGLTDVAVATSTSPNPLESNTFTLVTITEQAKNSSSVQDSANVNNVIISKFDLEEVTRFQDNSSANGGINRSIENQITHIDNLSESNSSLIDDLKDENLHEQLSEAKLQEISDRLINALWPIIEKRMNNNRSYVADHYNNQWNKNLPPNIFDSRQTIYGLSSNNTKNHDQVEDATSRSQENQDYSQRKETYQ